MNTEFNNFALTDFKRRQCSAVNIRFKIFLDCNILTDEKKAYALNHISFLKGSGTASEQLNVKNGHTLCWKHSIIFTSSLFYEIFQIYKKTRTEIML